MDYKLNPAKPPGPARHSQFNATLRNSQQKFVFYARFYTKKTRFTGISSIGRSTTNSRLFSILHLLGLTLRRCHVTMLP